MGDGAQHLAPIVLVRLKKKFPDEPWRWRADWEQGLSVETNLRPAGAWVLTVLIPTIICVIWRLSNGRWMWRPGTTPWALIAAAIIGTLLLIFAIMRTIHVARYGCPVLKLDAVPCPRGGVVRGAIEFPGRHLPASRDVDLELRETHTTSVGGGQHLASRRTEVVWHLRLPLVLHGIEKSIPVQLPIPSDGKETKLDNVEWTVRLRAVVPGRDLGASFEIPVFGTEGGNPAQTKELVDQAAARAGRNVGQEDLAAELDQLLPQPPEPES